MFSVNTIFDCNNSIFEHTVDDLIQRLSNKKLECCTTEMPLEIIQRLRKGVLASRLIEARIKKQLIANPDS